MEQEKQLFSLAKKLYEEKFWNDYWDTDLIAIQLENQKEPIMISILGKSEQNYGFLFYRNSKELSYFFDIVEQSNWRNQRTPGEILQLQKCLALEYENRLDLDKKAYQRIKSSGISFRGKKAWPIFMDYCPGYYPYPAEKADERMLIDVMEKLLDTAKDFRKKLAFYETERMSQEILLRTYHKDGSYEDGVLNLAKYIADGAAHVEEAPVLVTKFEMKRVASQKFGTSIWELDVGFIETPIIPSEGGRPYFPTLLLVVNSETGQIICSEFIKPGDTESLQRLLIQLILSENGRPATIVVDACRYAHIACDLGKLFSQLDIELTPIQKLPLISVIKEDMLEYLEQ
ncbi:DUF7309 domain-containing protein [Carnobacterium mobile]|uniref:DUF7309 domain-containing protein n=1 Tax=Carnobacterium mobile TaxID=2750 RepID=UPI00054E24FE|nr:hypothetical protein [Carnobacterium mobile]